MFILGNRLITHTTIRIRFVPLRSEPPLALAGSALYPEDSDTK